MYRHSQEVNLEFRSLKIYTLIVIFCLFVGLVVFNFKAKFDSSDQQNFSAFFQKQVNTPVRDLIAIITWNYSVSKDCVVVKAMDSVCFTENVLRCLAPFARIPNTLCIKPCKTGVANMIEICHVFSI